LSGRFGDGGILLPRLVHTSTQTSVSDVETPAVHVWAPVDQATSTEGCVYLTVEILISVIFVNENESGEKPENNKFVNKN